MSHSDLQVYPGTPVDRDRWIVARRTESNRLNPLEPYAFFLEDERTALGEIVPIVTVFLTNRECPWRCLMCDLWKNTLEHSVAPGMICAQIEYALQRLGAGRQIKLYNSGSFFDPKAIPIEDHPAIANQVRNFDRVIVECHPKLVADACLRFRDRLSGAFEVAMGLETAHPQVLDRAE